MGIPEKIGRFHKDLNVYLHIHMGTHTGLYSNRRQKSLWEIKWESDFALVLSQFVYSFSSLIIVSSRMTTSNRISY